MTREESKQLTLYKMKKSSGKEFGQAIIDHFKVFSDEGEKPSITTQEITPLEILKGMHLESPVV